MSLEVNRRNIKDAGDPYFASTAAGAQAATLLGAIQNRAFTAGQSGNVTGNTPAAQIMYVVELRSLASGFFQCWFNGTMTPSGAGTSTLSVATQIATVAGSAFAASGSATSVGNLGTTATGGCQISSAVGGITPGFAGGTAAAVVHASQVQISAATDLDIPYGFNLIVGASIASPAARVALGSGVIIELLVSLTGVNTLTPLALSNAFGAYELP